MSRFDDELIKQAENAYQQRKLPEPTTPGINYDQTSNLNLDGPYGLSSQAPAPAEEAADWIANQPATRLLEVRDLDAADPAVGQQGEIIGGPGSSAVYAEGGPMYATKNPIDESLYNVYKASREIRDAIDNQTDFDFSNLVTASNEAATVLRFASANDDVNQVVGTVASIVLDIENDLATTGDYRQASADLAQLESLLEDINKVASADAAEDDEEKADGLDDATTASNAGGTPWDQSIGHDEFAYIRNKLDNDRARGVYSEPDYHAQMLENYNRHDANGHCTEKGCEFTTPPEVIQKRHQEMLDRAKNDDQKLKKAKKKLKKKEATNGNQETLQVVDVRDLDDQAGVWDRDRAMSPDHQTNVLVPEEVNGEDAGYVPFYNDGSETGITPGEEPNKQVVWPNDGTNPAFAPYAGTVAAVQASREKIFESLQIVERLEKLGMVNHDDRAKHIAKFEQMSDAKLAGFKQSLDMLEESGARQPRSQKVASGSNRLPEMGRLTTASTVTRQDITSDDWLMTL